MIAFQFEWIRFDFPGEWFTGTGGVNLEVESCFYLLLIINI